MKNLKNEKLISAESKIYTHKTKSDWIEGAAFYVTSKVDIPEGSFLFIYKEGEEADGELFQADERYMNLCLKDENEDYSKFPSVWEILNK